MDELIEKLISEWHRLPHEIVEAMVRVPEIAAKWRAEFAPQIAALQQSGRLVLVAPDRDHPIQYDSIVVIWPVGYTTLSEHFTVQHGFVVRWHGKFYSTKMCPDSLYVPCYGRLLVTGPLIPDEGSVIGPNKSILQLLPNQYE